MDSKGRIKGPIKSFFEYISVLRAGSLNCEDSYPALLSQIPILYFSSSFGSASSVLPGLQADISLVAN